MTGTQPTLVLMLLTQFCCKIMSAYEHSKSFLVGTSTLPSLSSQASFVVSSSPFPPVIEA